MRPTATTKRGWIEDASVSSMDGSSGVTLELRADNVIDGWLAKSQPVLFVRCREGRTDVFVETGMRAAPEYGLFQEYSIRYRLDERPPVTATWSESTDGEALFAPNAREVIDSLLGASRLRFEFTPFNSNKAVVEFQISRLGAVVGRVSSACRWQHSDSVSKAFVDSLDAPERDANKAARVYFKSQVETQATLLPTSNGPAKCPPGRSENDLPLVQFVVRGDGVPDTLTYQLVHDAPFPALVEDFPRVLPTMRFSPAKASGVSVSELVQMPACRVSSHGPE